MRFSKIPFWASLFFFFGLNAHIAGAQSGETIKQYNNDKYGISFSFPSAFLLEVVNQDEWIIRNQDKSWAIGFKILHLKGQVYNTYINSFTTSLFNTLAKGYGLSATLIGTPEKKPYRECMIQGFTVDQFLAGSMGEGAGVEKLFTSWNLYLHVFRKFNKANFDADGIIIYDFRQPLDNPGHKLTKQVISSFEKTLAFNGAFVTRPVVPVAEKKPVTTTPVVMPVTVPVTTGPSPKVAIVAKENRPPRKKGLYIFRGYYGKAGFTNELYEVVYDTLYSTHYITWSEGYAGLGKDNKWGYIDSTGKIVVPFIYDDSKYFINGYAPVKKNREWGFVNVRGDEVISFLYNDARYFSENLAAVQLGDYWGYIDITNTLRIENRFDYAFDFSEGAAAVQLDRRWGYINKEGKFLFPEMFQKAGFFKNGKAVVEKDGAEFTIDITGKRIN